MESPETGFHFRIWSKRGDYDAAKEEVEEAIRCELDRREAA
jgi:hypothetical protein